MNNNLDEKRTNDNKIPQTKNNGSSYPPYQNNNRSTYKPETRSGNEGRYNNSNTHKENNGGYQNSRNYQTKNEVFNGKTKPNIDFAGLKSLN